ncbi:MAG: hypothetical protein K9M07_01695 [Simkaniaceae bacterium]|nr:hypothetical protein [Simkaniaceae bacterium]
MNQELKINHSKPSEGKSTLSSSEPKPFKAFYEKKKNLDEEKKQEQPLDPPPPLMTPFELFTETHQSHCKLQAIQASTQAIYDLADVIESHVISLQKMEDSHQMLTTYCNENSPFNSLSIEMTHYNTAPGSCHIQFLGTTEMIQKLDTHIATLANRLSNAFPETAFHFKPSQLKEPFQTSQFKKLNKKQKIEYGLKVHTK